MKHSYQEEKISKKISELIADASPGVVLRAYNKGRLVVNVSVGKTYPYYDLASLTKIIFTQQAMIMAYSEGLWREDQKVKELVPELSFESITVKELLTHTSGLAAYAPLYKSIPLSLTWEKKRDWVFENINGMNLESKSKAVYSDLGFILLGFLLERIYKKNILEIWEVIKDRCYSITNFEFHKDNKPVFPVGLYAPTEVCPWRKKLVQGEVHDENTWSFGGISTHAGLFGSIEDVSHYGLMIRSQLLGIARYQVKQSVARLFAKRQIDEQVGDWAMGYMLPSKETASCGPYFSRTSIGHTGFTGTSIWYDHEKDFLVVMLSNRVNFGRDNTRFATLRPVIHSCVYQAIKGL